MLQCYDCFTLSGDQSSVFVQQELEWPPGYSHSGRRQILFQPGWSCWQPAQHRVSTGLLLCHSGVSISAVPNPTHSTHQEEKQNYFNKGEGSPMPRENHPKCFPSYLLITESLQSLCTLFEDIESPSNGKKLYVQVLVQEQKGIKIHHI